MCINARETKFTPKTSSVNRMFAITSLKMFNKENEQGFVFSCRENLSLSLPFPFIVQTTKKSLKKMKVWVIGKSLLVHNNILLCWNKENFVITFGEEKKESWIQLRTLLNTLNFWRIREYIFNFERKFIEDFFLISKENSEKIFLILKENSEKIFLNWKEISITFFDDFYSFQIYSKLRLVIKFAALRIDIKCQWFLGTLMVFFRKTWKMREIESKNWKKSEFFLRVSNLFIIITKILNSQSQPAALKITIHFSFKHPQIHKVCSNTF